MKRSASAIAALCLAVVSRAAETDWLPSASASLGTRESWQALPLRDFTEVPVSRFPLAQAVLSKQPFISRTAGEVASLLGRSQSFACHAGLRPYLLRAMYRGTGEFSLLWSEGTLIVAHGSIGAGGKSQRSALVACLAKAPTAVVGLVGGAI